MAYHASTGLEEFKSHIGIPFQLYNSLFTSLPFHKIEKTGILLSLFLENCSEGYEKKDSPAAIIEDFFKRHTTHKTDTEKLDLLFRFVQYVERQIVLFDALEDAAFKKVNDVDGIGTLKYLESEVVQKKADTALANKLKEFSVRIVLTAHPTQFYPGPVLGIINDLSHALRDNKTDEVNMYLQQLGKTAFLNKTSPTPYDEAVSLIWFLDNVFYAATGRMMSFLKGKFPNAVSADNPCIRLGFWPGGDRDGNPNVDTAITLKVADALRTSILKCYYRDIRNIKRRLTFKGVEHILSALEAKLYKNIYGESISNDFTSGTILYALNEVRDIVNDQHNGLFVSLIEDLISKVQVFGFHFASLDIRQESSVHTALINMIAENDKILPQDYQSKTETEKIDILCSLNGFANTELYEGIYKDSLLSAAAIKVIQQKNGEAGCHRYIISQCNSALNIIEVYAIFLLSNWQKESLSIDIVPLFETIEDLKQSTIIMETIFTNEIYKAHLKQRANKQTIMVGFSDGTKDGGYLMANWSIYNAKRELTEVGRKHGIDIIFFDGRGGPPSRGGGKTHKFYAAMGKSISNKEIQLTIQGQTISSGFGTKDAAQFNMEQLMTAGISNELFPIEEKKLGESEKDLLKEASQVSMNKYLSLRNHPKLMDYLVNISPIKFYGETNIGSRPTKRNAGSTLVLKDLRAIPYVGAWSQLKQNVTGYYGIGTALQKIEVDGKWELIVQLYKNSLFVKTLIDNAEMSMNKCYFPLTEVLAKDDEFSGIWNEIHDEYQLSKKYILKLTGKQVLMADYPVEQLSISMREKIVLPLTTIQQYALANLRNMKEPADTKLRTVFEKLVIRCSFGIINAGRNSV